MKRHFLKNFCTFALMIALIIGLLPQNVNSSPEDYNSYDVEIIKAIIAENGLDWHPTDPTMWPTNGSTNIGWTSAPNRRIKYLNISGNNLTGDLDLSGCTALERLSCFNNNLTSINLSGCTSLTFVSCYKNNLTSINLSNCINLGLLSCNQNELTSLDVSDCVSLEEMWCIDNQLTSLNVSGCTELSSLDCQNNNLTDLDLSTNVKLSYIDCSNNSISSLDFSNNTDLYYLICQDNPLQSLSMPSGDKIAVSANPNKGGNVFLSHERNTNLMESETVFFTATENSGYTFDHWSGGASGGKTSDPYPLPKVTTNIVANFISPGGNNPADGGNPSFGSSGGSSGSGGYGNPKTVAGILPVTGEGDSAFLGMMVMCIGIALYFSLTFFLKKDRKQRKTSY